MPPSEGRSKSIGKVVSLLSNSIRSIDEKDTLKFLNVFIIATGICLLCAICKKCVQQQLRNFFSRPHIYGSWSTYRDHEVNGIRDKRAHKKPRKAIMLKLKLIHLGAEGVAKKNGRSHRRVSFVL